MQNSINDLIGREPVVIPHGTLPDSFFPAEGSVFDAFVPGLPPVIFIGGQYYPLTQEELGRIKAQMAGGGSPEKFPQAPRALTNIETAIDSSQTFERSFEQQSEKAPEKEKQNDQQSANNRSTQPVTTQYQQVTDKKIVNIKDLIGRGTDLVDQRKLDDAYNAHKAGTLNPSKTTSNSSDWLDWLLLKVFTKGEK